MIDTTGGPAFPLDRDVVNVGMTLRDYFAAKAMQSLIIASCTEENALLTVLNRIKTEVEMEHWIAYSAYAVADAMLKEKSE